MAKSRELGEYCFVGDFDFKKLEVLHGLTTRFRDSFLEDRALQNVLLNQGYELPNDERPKSYFMVHDAVFNRSVVAIQLEYLEHVIDVATRPQIIVTSTPRVWVPGQDTGTKIETAAGHDASRVELLQQHWLSSPNLSERVRKFQARLQEAFDEYNLQFILGRMLNCQKQTMPRNAKPEAAIHEELKQAMFKGGNSAMDSAYYNKARFFSSGCPQLWQEVSKTDSGMMFLVKPDEIHREITRIRSRKSD